jgi:hypothetical protein
MKSIWPELWGEIGTTKHGTKSVANSAMRMLTRTVLMRGIWGSQFDGVACILKKGNNVRAMAKLTTKIKTNIFIRNFDRQTMTGKPAI